MLIDLGFDIIYQVFQPTPMVLMLNVHSSRAADMVQPDLIRFDPPVATSMYYDGFGNLCTRLVAPAGPFRMRTAARIRDTGSFDLQDYSATEIPVPELPAEILCFLLGSRYCETDLLTDTAWSLFGHIAPGWGRVQSIVDYVHGHLSFGYHHARVTKTAFEAYRERTGVCRDFAHLAITLCRAMGIPARYATGYLGDIGVPIDVNPMDFSAWFEVYLSGRWHTFDARHAHPRLGRILMARGRDAADVALTTSFGRVDLAQFNVQTDEVV